MTKTEEAVLGGIGLGIVLVIVIGLAIKQHEYYEFIDRQQAREAQWHEEWKKDHGCVHTGYYGRFGGKRTYVCEGRVLVEQGTRMYDKERGVYVKNN